MDTHGTKISTRFNISGGYHDGTSFSIEADENATLREVLIALAEDDEIDYEDDYQSYLNNRHLDKQKTILENNIKSGDTVYLVYNPTAADDGGISYGDFVGLVTAINSFVAAGGSAKFFIDTLRLWIEDRKARKIRIEKDGIKLEIHGQMNNKQIRSTILEFDRLTGSSKEAYLKRSSENMPDINLGVEVFNDKDEK